MSKDTVIPLKRKGARCPNCGKAAVEEYRPFCSKRCADVDLGRWLNEDYRVPTDEVPGLDADGFDET